MLHQPLASKYDSVIQFVAARLALLRRLQAQILPPPLYGTQDYTRTLLHCRTNFRPGFLEKMGGTRNEYGGFGKISSRRLHSIDCCCCIAGRIQYALPVAEEPRFDIDTYQVFILIFG